MSIRIDGHHLTIEDVIKVARFKEAVELTETAILAINKSRALIDELLMNDKAIYGVNTGFGKLSNISIGKNQISELQKNLLVSHAVGAGEAFSNEIVRAMMLLRINSLAQGYSGIRLTTVETLLAMLNKDVIPVVPEKGSLGASGDLAPLAHMALPLIGKGKCTYQKEILPGDLAMKKANLKVIELEAKEGLALINGTQAMCAVGTICLYDAYDLFNNLNMASALSMEALRGIIDAFDERIHNLRPHHGQIVTNKAIRNLLTNSKMITRQGEMRVQDGYSLRCIAQIHGASYDALSYVKEQVEIEINSVTDNPLIFTDTKEAISGGNFHGQPLAIAFDLLGIALAEMADVSERRIERLVNPALNDLPAFLTPEGGVNSGYMIVQYSAASLVSENKVLAHPASVDSIPSSAGQEDHVSMGTIAGRKALAILKNTRRVIAMEIMCAIQGIDLAGNLGLGIGTKVIYDIVRNKIPMVIKDREFYEDINEIEQMIIDHQFVDLNEKLLKEE